MCDEFRFWVLRLRAPCGSFRQGALWARHRHRHRDISSMVMGEVGVTGIGLMWFSDSDTGFFLYEYSVLRTAALRVFSLFLFL